MSKENTRHKPTKLIAILIAFCLLITLAAGWLLFCVLDCADPIDSIPGGFLIFGRSDSIGSSIESLLDLRALDVLLASPESGDLRESLYAFRTSSLRKSALFSLAASRRVDLALYGDGSFSAIVHMGFLSALSRIAPLFAGLFRADGLSFVQTEGSSYFRYEAGSLSFYAAAKKDLLCVSSSRALLNKMQEGGAAAGYSPETLERLKEKPRQAFKLSADLPFLIDSLLADSDDAVLSRLRTELLPLFRAYDLGSVEFDISDTMMSIDISAPLADPAEAADSTLAPLFSSDSRTPSLPALLSDSVQYYTILNAGSLAELKESIFPVMQAGTDAALLWRRADTASRALFGLDLERLIFSWTGREFSVFGMETNADPVFAVKITDERMRRQVFERLFASYIVTDNKSLIIDGARLPQIEIPPIIDSLLKTSGIQMVKPYYLVIDGFIYFSQSAENLSALYSGAKKSGKLSASENWKLISRGQTPDMTMGLFYNLEKSIPFFLRSQSPFSRMLSLYNIGRCDVRVRSGALTVSIRALSRTTFSARAVPGFPVKTEGRISHELIADSRGSHVFYMEGTDRIKSFNPVSGKTYTAVMESGGWIAAAEEKINKKNTGELWAVSRNGYVYLFSSELEPVEGFPVLAGFTPSAPPRAAGTRLFIPAEGGALYVAEASGQVSLAADGLPGELKAAPAVLGDVITLYAKRLIGQVVLLQASHPQTLLAELPVPGIAFGSPALVQSRGRLLAGFVTQSGSFSVWDASGVMLPGFPVELPGVYYGNAVSANDAFYLLSQEGLLTRVSLKGEVTQVAVPHLTAKEPVLTALNYDGRGKDEIFLSGDSNLIYGFSDELELLAGFPVVGHGSPVFMDINGGRAECLAVSLDNTIVAWTMP